MGREVSQENTAAFVAARERENITLMSPRKSATDSWRTPTAGLCPHRLGDFLNITVDYKVGTGEFWDGLSSLFARLVTLLGDHTVRITAGNKISHDSVQKLGGKLSSDGQTLSIRLGQLADPSAWRTVLASVKGEIFWIMASRGAGKTRHDVWCLHPVHHYDRNIDRISLCVAAQHISAPTYRYTACPPAERLCEETQVVVDEFIERVCTKADVVYGAANLVMADVNDGGVLSAHTFDYTGPGGSLAENLLRFSYTQGQTLVGAVRAINLFGPAMLKRLGGIERLRSRVYDFDHKARRAGETPPSRDVDHPPMRVRAFGKCAAIVIYPFTPQLEWPSFRFTDLPPNELWLWNELARAGLLAQSHQGWQRARIKTVSNRRRSDILHAAADHEPQVPAQPKKLDWHAYLAHMRNNKPQTIQNGRLVERVPGSNAPNLVSYELLKNGAPGGLTIYGREVEPGLTALVSPLLVGSLIPKRAACHFNSSIHGHDGFQKRQSGGSVQQSRLKQLSCPKCKGRLFKAWAQLEYPDDFDDLRHEPEYPVRHELFTWFYLHAQCVSCQWHDEVASIECA